MTRKRTTSLMTTPEGRRLASSLLRDAVLEQRRTGKSPSWITVTRLPDKKRKNPSSPIQMIAGNSIVWKVAAIGGVALAGFFLWKWITVQGLTDKVKTDIINLINKSKKMDTLAAGSTEAISLQREINFELKGLADDFDKLNDPSNNPLGAFNGIIDKVFGILGFSSDEIKALKVLGGAAGALLIWKWIKNKTGGPKGPKGGTPVQYVVLQDRLANSNPNTKLAVFEEFKALDFDTQMMGYMGAAMTAPEIFTDSTLPVPVVAYDPASAPQYGWHWDPKIPWNDPAWQAVGAGILAGLIVILTRGGSLAPAMNNIMLYPTDIRTVDNI